MSKIKQAEYTVGELQWEVFFIKGKERCFDCPLCKYETGFGRYYCSLTSVILFDPKMICLGRNCPLKFKEVDNEKR